MERPTLRDDQLASHRGGGGDLERAPHTANAVTQDWYDIVFDPPLGNKARLIGAIATYDGGDNCHLKFNEGTLTPYGVQVKVDEDRSYDDETDHTSEVIHYLALGGDGLLSARTAGSGSSAQDWGYGYNEVGNIITKTEKTQTWTYNYDDEDHVHAVTSLSNGWAFQYDPTLAIRQCHRRQHGLADRRPRLTLFAGRTAAGATPRPSTSRIDS